MKNRKIALLLSCLYCGLGQIYKREILKGIDFAFIYTILIVCFLSSERILFYIGAFSLPLLWIIGVIDAYGIESYQPPNIKARFLFVVLAELVIAPILLLAHGYFLSNTERAVTPKENSSRIQVDVKAGKQQSPTGRHADAAPTNDATGTEVTADKKQEELPSPKPPPDKGEKPLQPEEKQQAREKDDGRRAGEASLPADVFGQATEKRIYSVLVGSFTDEAQANRLRDKLQGKGYTAWVKPTFLRSKGQLWYGVRVGKFSSKKDAQAMALKLHRKERLEYKVKKEVSGE